MITKLLNEVNEKIETLNNLVQDKEYFEKLDERIEKVNNYVQKQEQENKRLHKAIKYIEERFTIENGEYYLTHTFDKDNVKELYDILRGDKE